MAGSAGSTAQSAGSGGASAGASGAGTNAGGSAGSGGGGQGGDSAATAFEPNVPEVYMGSVMSPGMEVIAHTARTTATGKEWLASVKSTGTDQLCTVDVNFTFLDANGMKLGSATGVPLDTGLDRGTNGTGSLVSCLAPGKIGMLKDTLALQDVDISKIAKVTYDFGAIVITDAVPTDDIKVTDVMAVAGSAGGQVFSGTLKNDGQTSVKNPTVNIYGVNAAGRPLFSSEAIELAMIPAAGTWSFMTLASFNEPYTDYAAYAQVRDN